MQCTTAELYRELISHAGRPPVLLHQNGSSLGRGRLVSTVDQDDAPSLDCSLCATQGFISGPVTQISVPSRTANVRKLSFRPTPTIVSRNGPRCLWNSLLSCLRSRTPFNCKAVATNDFVEKSFDYAKCSFGAREDMLELIQIF